MSEYTEPKLRKRLKEKIQQGDKGGKPGQWSARKAQLLVQRYEAEGGGYKGKKSGRQKHLEQWGDQKWHTVGGDRYLPDVAWRLLSKKERAATNTRKKDGEQQFVANTDAAKEARAAAELATMKAGPARKHVKAMTTKSALRRARRAEKQHGKARTSVLAEIEKRL